MHQIGVIWCICEYQRELEITCRCPISSRWAGASQPFLGRTLCALIGEFEGETLPPHSPSGDIRGRESAYLGYFAAAGCAWDKKVVRTLNDSSCTSNGASIGGLGFVRGRFGHPSVSSSEDKSFCDLELSAAKCKLAKSFGVGLDALARLREQASTGRA